MQLPARWADRFPFLSPSSWAARWRWGIWAAALAAVGMAGCDGNYSSGDRVLVSKAPYDLKLKPPERFDVVVFKFPGTFNQEGPLKKGVPINYIKRLCGLPGEVIAIFFGQLFRMTPDPAVPVPGAPKDVNPLNLWMSANQPSGDQFSDFVNKGFETGSFEMLRKPPVVMLAERRIVFDNNHQPSDLKMLPARWSPAEKSGWKASSDRKTLTFRAEKDAVKEGEVDWLTYQHIPRPEGPVVGGITPRPRLITDAMGYNAFNLDLPEEFREYRNSIHVNWAGNLMLEANVTPDGSGGEFWMELNKGIDAFRAKFDLATGQCTLFRIGEDGKARQLDAKPTALTGAGTHLVRFANFNARLTVWVDSTLPFGDGVDYDPVELGTKGAPLTMEAIRQRVGPRPNDLHRPASLGGKNAGATVADLRLWRDTYYTMYVQGDEVALPAHVLADPNQWDGFHHVDPAGYCVYQGHYLCLGDNSTSSSDSRDWGLVPERLMLGRALAVYFPVERAGLIR